MDLDNVVRVGVLIVGGAIVGAGWVVLGERSAFYHRLGIRDASRAMLALSIVNLLVMTFIALVLIDRWDHALSWRTGLATAVFASKATFFFLLWRTGVEQERRARFDRD